MVDPSPDRRPTPSPLHTQVAELEHMTASTTNMAKVRISRPHVSTHAPAPHAPAPHTTSPNAPSPRAPSLHAPSLNSEPHALSPYAPSPNAPSPQGPLPTLPLPTLPLSMLSLPMLPLPMLPLPTCSPVPMLPLQPPCSPHAPGMHHASITHSSLARPNIYPSLLLTAGSTARLGFHGSIFVPAAKCEL